jgi:hypothetical protein
VGTFVNVFWEGVFCSKNCSNLTLKVKTYILSTVLCFKLFVSHICTITLKGLVKLQLKLPIITTSINTIMNYVRADFLTVGLIMTDFLQN